MQTNCFFLCHVSLAATTSEWYPHPSIQQAIHSKSRSGSIQTVSDRLRTRSWCRHSGSTALGRVLGP